MNDQKDVQNDVPLALLTTFEVGGAARFFWDAESETDVIDALNFAEQNDLPIFVLGGGSNLLICDKGFHGLVLKINLKGVSVAKDKTDVYVTAAAGEDWDNFVKFCVEQNLSGVECLSGIPGTVGATPVQNVGAYGQEVSDTIVTVRVVDRESLEIKNLINSECRFAYRSSIFNTIARDQFIVLSVTFCLEPNGAPNLRYADLQKYFADNSDAPSLQAVRQAVLKIRAAKSMVISREDANRRSAGSFFKNPIVSEGEFAEIEKKARELNLIVDNERVPHFSTNNDKIKIPAAWLIEKSGFYKGFRVGNVGLSTKHALAVVNCGDATAQEIFDFANHIKQQVYKVFGIYINPEPNFIGFE